MNCFTRAITTIPHHRSLGRFVLMWMFTVASIAGASEPAPPATLRIPAREPAEAVPSFRCQSGFEMQLLAAEPLVVDPVAIAYDEDGRAYVAEMRDYPYTDPSNDQPFTDRTTDLPLGRIRLLYDGDGDGIFDRSTIYADQLSWPSGLVVSRGGLYVAATPDIWYFKDVDGDGRADQRNRVLTGFRKFNVQALMNNLQWGIDHQLYGAGSSNGGQILLGDNANAQPVTLATQDFRFDPADNQFELLAGGGRFGNTFNDWGERFICNIRNPIRHIVVPDEWARVAVPLAAGDLVHDVAESGDTIPVYRLSSPEPWRVINSLRLAQTIERTSPRSESVAAGYMTSACGLTFYRGSAYPPEFYGQAFLGEVAGNLIHRQQLVREGTTYRSQRVDERCEFVASSDNWFRPVNFVNAPDGTLHIADMYRETIEHPWSIPDDIKAQLDLENGRDRGRIYRLAPPGFQPSKTCRLSEFTTAELVECLAHPDGWRRDTAHRLLFERQDSDAVPLLRKVLEKRAVDSPNGAQPDFAAVARVLALWSLAGLQALSSADIELAFSDPAWQVRQQAVRLAAIYRLSPVPESLTGDPEPGVRAEIAWALAAHKDSRAAELLAHLCRQDTSDPWLRAAILAASDQNAPQLIVQLMAANSLPRAKNSVDLLLLKQLARLVAQRGRADQINQVLSVVSTNVDAAVSFSVLTGCAQGLSSAGPPATLLHINLDENVRSWLAKQLAKAGEVAIDDASEIIVRVESVELLGQCDYETAAPVLTTLLSAAQPSAIQVAAVRALGRFDEPPVGSLLIDNYRMLAPAAQQQSLEALSVGERIPLLLEALEQDRIHFAALSVAQRIVLLRSPNAEWKSRALVLAEKQQQTPRAAVIDEYAQAISELTANPQQGREVFRRVCATCHRLERQGADLGPPLETVQHRSPGELLIAILDPSRELLPNYIEYAVILKEGTTATGVLSAESTTAITLQRSGDIQQTIARSDIDTIISTGKSMMPEGLERELTQQDMADLLAYLRQPH